MRPEFHTIDVHWRDLVRADHVLAAAQRKETRDAIASKGLSGALFAEWSASIGRVRHAIRVSGAPVGRDD